MTQKMIEPPFGRNDGHRGRRVCGKYQIAAALPDAELVILPVLHHAILLEAADQVAPPVLDFLTRHKAGEPSAL